MTSKNQPLTLITGGTGKTGRRVAQRLTALGRPVRIGSRRENPSFDWERPETWGPALEGVEQVYLSYQPDLAFPGALETVGAFTQQAVAAGAKKLVLLSGRGEELAQRGEEIVKSAGVDWTVVRASWFNQNFNEGHMLPQVQEGVVALPVGPTPEPFIDVDDIADVAAAALAEDGHAGELYEVTGPRLMTFEEIVAEIAEATGRDVKFVSISADAYRAGMKQAQVPDALADFLIWLMTEVLDGRNAYVTDGVERALGRPARDFSAYARAAAATGVWSVS